MLYIFFPRPWRPSEVDEIKIECFISNLPISGSQKLSTFDYNVINLWKLVGLKCLKASPMSLYTLFIIIYYQNDVAKRESTLFWLSFSIFTKDWLKKGLKKSLVFRHHFGKILLSELYNCVLCEKSNRLFCYWKING